MKDKTYISSLIPDNILQKCYYELSLNPTKVLLCNTIYHFINSGYEITPQNLETQIKLNIKTIYENLESLETGGVFQKITTDSSDEQWVSLFPTNKYFIAKKGCVGQNGKFVTFYSCLPCTQIIIEFYLSVSEVEIDYFNKINDQECYLIDYRFPQILEYSLDLQLITVKAHNISNITPIKSLGFDIDDKWKTQSIHKNFIIQEKP